MHNTPVIDPVTRSESGKPRPIRASRDWIEYRLPIFSFIDNMVGTGYPAPRNLSYWWNFGVLAGLCLVVQILTGIFLAMHYVADTNLAFNSVENIMRNVNYGWLLRYTHAVGASMFFIVVYIHIFRNLYYGSYKFPRELLWWLGIVILLIMMATAFMGYVLPWGQMSFWGATVITSLFSAFPLVGESIVTWLWGGFSVDQPTLNRFFALHYLLPFVLVGIVILHIAALHQHGSNNPLGIDVKGPQDTVPFHPYYTAKDAFGIAVFLIFFAGFVFFAPNYLGHPDNYTPANAMVTPAHIVPEWYFLPFYAILRAVTFNIPLWMAGFGLVALGGGGLLMLPRLSDGKRTALFLALAMGIIVAVLGFATGYKLEAKLLGVLAMFGSIILLFFLPWLDQSPVRSATFRPWSKILFWVLVLDAVVLTYVGGKPPEGWYVVIGQLATAYYFAHFLVILPWVSKNEPILPLPESIANPVLR